MSYEAATRLQAPDARGGLTDRKRLRAQPRLGFGILAVAVLCFAGFAASRMLPAQDYGLAVDWRVFYAAAAVTHAGGNPYAPMVLHAAEQGADHYSTVQPTLDDYANLPVIAWVLQPVALLPFWVSYALLTVLSVISAGVALFFWLRRWGWRQPGRSVVLALMSWPALLGVFSGQFDLLLLAALLGAMALSLSRRPGFAGAACMAAVLVKPHILWPLPLLLIASQWPDRRAAARATIAAGVTAAVLMGAAEIFMPGDTERFVAHLLLFGGRIATGQPDLSGLPGMVGHLPGGSVIATAIAGVGALATLGFAWFWATSARARATSPDIRMGLGVGAGLAIWLVATPYGHPNDDVLLFPLIALLVGPDAARIRQPDVMEALAACVLLIAGFAASPLLGTVFAACLAMMIWRHRPVAARRVAAYALVSIAVLPTIWPFHVLPVSLTPLAVLTVAAAGFALVRTACRSKGDVAVLARRE